MFEDAIKVVRESNLIYVVAHINPDGDAIGSTFAIYFALKELGKDVHVVMPSYSTVFDFLPGIDTRVDNIKEDEYDLLIALDSSDHTRLALSEEDFNKAKKVIMMDHHQMSRPYGDFRYIYDLKSSASEIAYLFIKELGIEFTSDIATLLYTGIMTDTGSFNYNNTSAATLRAAAELVEFGAKYIEVCKKLNDTMKEAKLRLVAKTIDNMESFYDGKFKYSYVSYEDINKLGINDEESEGMTNYLRSIEGCEVAAYVRGRSDGTLKVSMRSNGKVDISRIAIEFGGGGHPRAAGYTMRESLEIEKEKLIKAVGEMI